MTKTAVVTVSVVLAAAVGAAAWWLVTPRDGAQAQGTVPIDTTAVVRTTLTTTSQQSGTLGYTGSYAITPQLTGTLTALPAPGTMIRRDQPIYEVDGAGVFLFYGARPAWRAFAIGMTPGTDVLELEQNLTELGFGSGVTVDDSFTWATVQAVREWQLATGQVVTGTVELGRIAFAPTALRIVADEVPLGSPAQPGQTAITASSPTPIVSMPVPVAQSYLVHRGDRVTVTLPSGAASPGTVVDVSSVATAVSSGSGDQSNGNNAPQQATVPALVTLEHPAIVQGLDQAPVSVTVSDRRESDVLAVPITSLVALSGGGYAVWVDASGGRHLVAVTPGLFADTLVQVTAAGLQVGDRVEMPAQ